MRTAFVISALAGLALAAPNPRPQDIDFDAIDTAPPPTVLGPALAAVSDSVNYNPSAAATSVEAAVATDPSDPTPLDKRALNVKRGVNDPCATQPDGYGPKTTPDTASAFEANPTYTAIASNAPVPQGYSQSFSNLQGSVSMDGYLGLTTLNTFDTIKCQQLCDAAPACQAFNIYIERDPSVNPADACPNPSSITNFKCTLWGMPVTAAAATNQGQYRDQFQVVITGSNGYNKLAPPPSYTNFTGPTEFGGAINAPGNTYIGVKYFTGPYDPSLCAAACQATTAYDHRHPSSTGAYSACNFFNSYVLSKNDVAQGTYCSLYTQTWDKSYSTNYGQYRGSDYYGVSQSYGYTLTATDPGHI